MVKLDFLDFGQTWLTDRQASFILSRYVGNIEPVEEFMTQSSLKTRRPTRGRSNPGFTLVELLV
ncbi:MAG: hypothetical protein AAF743_12120, partial [Planctomycetota bacterium]